MKLGLQVSNFTWPGAPESIGPTFGRIAREADDAGVASLWVMDHFFQISSIGPPEHEMLAQRIPARRYASHLPA